MIWNRIMPLVLLMTIITSRIIMGQTKEKLNEDTPININSSLLLSALDLERLSYEAISGDGEAAFSVYVHFSYGFLDQPKTIYWLTIGAENGHAGCQNSLADILSWPNDKDTRKIFWLKKAYLNENPYALEELKRYGLTPDKAVKLSLIFSASNINDLSGNSKQQQAIDELGMTTSEAVNLWQILFTGWRDLSAYKGQQFAIEELKRLGIDPNEPPPDDVLFIRSNQILSDSEINHCKEGALQGNGKAAFMLGNYYRFIKDEINAEYWYQIGAQNDNAECQYQLGLILSQSESALEKKRSIVWLKKAEQNGYH